MGDGEIDGEWYIIRRQWIAAKRARRRFVGRGPLEDVLAKAIVTEHVATRRGPQRRLNE